MVLKTPYVAGGCEADGHQEDEHGAIAAIHLSSP